MEENKNQEVVEETVEETLEADVQTEETEGATAENAEGEVTEAEQSEETEEAAEPTKEKSKLFKKKKDPRDEKIEELSDKLLRQMAEFDNFRKRTEKEKSAMYEIGAKDIIEKLLPVVDNFERGLGAILEEEKNSPFAEGMNMIYKQLMTELENLGVKPIEAVGKEFDPNLHNAVMQVESEEYEEGVIAQELLKGYMYRDTVVRYSMVAVTQ